MYIFDLNMSKQATDHSNPYHVSSSVKDQLLNHASSNFTSSSSIPLSLWHQRFSHTSSSIVKNVLAQSNISFKETNDSYLLCSTYQINKSYRLLNEYRNHMLLVHFNLFILMYRFTPSFILMDINIMLTLLISTHVILGFIFLKEKNDMF